MQCNLKKIRQEQNLTYADFQKKTGLHPGNLTKIERGANVTLKTAYIISKALDVPVDDVWPNTVKMVEEKKTVVTRKAVFE